jgi:hypothetical protein
MTKFKHFETESGRTIMTAQFDGYLIADRLLEGLMFQITIQEDGSLKASVKTEDEDHFSQFNTVKFLKEAEDFAADCDIFSDTITGEECWLVVDGEDNRPKSNAIPIKIGATPTSDIINSLGSTQSNSDSDEEKEPTIGEFKPKRKFLNFVSAISGARVRLLRTTAFLKGEKISGVLEGVKFKITICDEGTINFEEVDTNQTDKAMIQRLINDIDLMGVNGYAQKFIVTNLEFRDADDQLCYLEVEHEKPINRFASILDSLREEEDRVEEVSTTISNKGLSLLDSLFGESEEKDINESIEESEEEVEEVVEQKSESLSHLEESFRKMNEGKVNELKKRIEDSQKDIIKYKNDVNFAERKLKEVNENLGVLQTRLESMTPGDEPNGYVFFVSEEQKNDLGLDDKTKEVAGKIADLMNLKKDVLFKHLTEGFYKIRIAKKDDFENLDIDRDILTKVASIDILGNLSMVEKGTFEYRGELNWHQLVGKMIRNGFEQVPEFDQHCSSNSYESHEEEKEDNFTGMYLGKSTEVGSGHPDDFESEFDKDEEFMFAIYEDLSNSNQLGEPQAMIQICPKSYFLEEGYAYDQHTEHEIKLRYPYLRTLGHQLEELCESSYAINDGTPDLNRMMHLNTRDTIEELCKAGLKMNRDFQNFISSKDLQMVVNTMNSIGYSNLVE